jgi:TrmH family RNA methyltransferase
MIRIESVNNDYIVYLNKLKDRSFRQTEKIFLVEGEHLILEAIKAKALHKLLAVSEVEGIETTLVNEKIITKLATTKSPQKMIGVCKMQDEAILAGQKKILILDDIADPVNLGGLFRSALGFGIELIILSSNTVDVYNDKTIRTSQGAVFHVPFLRGELKQILPQIDVDIIGTFLQDAVDVKTIGPLDSYALILGNESLGMKKDYLRFLKYNVKINTEAQLESLNVYAAGSILMYQFKK